MKGYLIGIGALYAKYLFKDHEFCHEFCWDCKKAANELFTGRNDFLPEWKFSYKDKVIYSLVGAARFLHAAAMRKPWS